jgi:hypothetical protein
MTIAYAGHILEEHTLNWRAWAKQAFGFEVTWESFYVTNATVIVLGISAAMIGWRLPEVSLMFPALAIVNAIFFHIAPTVIQRRFSPGLLTAVLLFLPLGAWTYYVAYVDQVMTIATAIISLVGGILLMAYPVILLRLKDTLAMRNE